MKNAELHLRTGLATRLHDTLSGLNEKHARKLQKHALRRVRKLARRVDRSFAKQTRATEKIQLAATESSVKELVYKLHQHLSRG